MISISRIRSRGDSARTPGDPSHRPAPLARPPGRPRAAPRASPTRRRRAYASFAQRPYPGCQTEYEPRARPRLLPRLIEGPPIVCAGLPYPSPEPRFACLYLHVEPGAARSTRGVGYFFGSSSGVQSGDVFHVERFVSTVVYVHVGNVA